MTLAKVAALYVDPRGPYPSLCEEWYDEKRDARKYEGPYPVVAHPPCRNWGQLKHLAKGNDSDCALVAVDHVRKFGGVLEHPAYSKLFTACCLPLPGELPDAFGGRTIEVCQVDYGHVARKRTWLYLVGVHNAGPVLPRREPSHWVSGGRKHERKGSGGVVPEGIKVCSAQQRRRSPIEFARWLVSLALQASK
jgi:hypothetical protein